MIRDILNHLGEVIGTLELPDDTAEDIWESRLAEYSLDPSLLPPQGKSIPDEIKDIKSNIDFSSLAVDKEGIDQPIEGTEWTKITASRVLWDFHENYSSESSVITIKTDAIYSFDMQLRIKEIVNVKMIEVAVFKVAQPEDDYWFVCMKRNIIPSWSETQLSNATQFDFYKDDQYFLAVKLEKENPALPCSASLVGDDDYSAWGLSMVRKL